MEKLTNAKLALEGFTVYQIKETEKIKGGAGIIIIEDSDVG